MVSEGAPVCFDRFLGIRTFASGRVFGCDVGGAPFLRCCCLRHKHVQTSRVEHLPLWRCGLVQKPLALPGARGHAGLRRCADAGLHGVPSLHVSVESGLQLVFVCVCLEQKKKKKLANMHTINVGTTCLGVLFCAFVVAMAVAVSRRLRVRVTFFCVSSRTRRLGAVADAEVPDPGQGA